MRDGSGVNGVSLRSQLEVECQRVRRAARTNKPASNGVRPKERVRTEHGGGKKGTVNEDITKVKIEEAKVPWTEEFL
jgi:hypothetical protein